MSKRFAIIKDNIVDGVAIAESPLETDGIWVEITDMSPMPGPKWIYENGVFNPPALLAPSPFKIISKVGFRFRLTDAEYTSILSAAKTDVEVASWVETFNMVSSLDLNNQRTKDGIQNLVNKNLLIQQRADEILTAPILPNE